MAVASPVHGASSTRRAMVAVLQEATATEPSGLTLAAWRARCAAQWPVTPAAFGGQVQGLRRTGDVVVSGGRVGYQRYLPAGVAPVVPPLAAEEDFVLRVLAALRAAEAAAGRPVTVAAVRAALPADTIPAHPHAVRRALMTLATPRRRGVRALQCPVFRRTDAGAAGHAITVWSTVPIRETVITLPSRAEALRQLVAVATDTVGVPLTATWLTAWCAASGHWASWPTPWRRGLRRALTDTARRPTTRLAVLGGPWATMPRFVLTDRTPAVARAAAHLEDLARRGDLAQEYDLLRGLMHRARTHRALAARVSARQRLIGALIAEALGDVPLEAALAQLDRAVVARAALKGRALQAEGREVSRQVQALRALLPMVTITAWPDRPAVIGEAGLMTPDAADTWARAATLAGDLTLRRAYTVMGNAGGVLVNGELRYDALRAVAALLYYTATPRLHQQVLALLDVRGTLDRAPVSVSPLEVFLATGAWSGSPLGATAKMRLRAGAWFGVLER